MRQTLTWFPVMRRVEAPRASGVAIFFKSHRMAAPYPHRAFWYGIFLHSRKIPSPMLLQMNAACRGTFADLDYEVSLRAVPVEFRRVCHVECVGVNYGKFCSILVLAFTIVCGGSPPAKAEPQVKDAEHVKGAPWWRPLRCRLSRILRLEVSLR
jgi:hypothetical protein